MPEPEPEQPLTADAVLSRARDIGDVQAGHSAALAQTEKANAEREAVEEAAEMELMRYVQAGHDGTVMRHLFL
jgi:hypothetical protein